MFGFGPQIGSELETQARILKAGSSPFGEWNDVGSLHLHANFVPPDVPPMGLGFHHTPLGLERQKPLTFQRLALTFWTMSGTVVTSVRLHEERATTGFSTSVARRPPVEMTEPSAYG